MRTSRPNGHRLRTMVGDGEALAPELQKLEKLRDSPHVVRTLLVEDNPFWQETIVKKLQEHGNLQVIAVVADGLEAVHNAEELQPDLVLLDIGLPRLDGMEVARRLRKVAPAARILFVSGEPDPAIIGEALRIGALGFVHKPNVASTLLPTIQAVFGCIVSVSG